MNSLIDFQAKTLMDAQLYGTLNTAQELMGKNFITNSRVVTANLPTTNDLTVAGASTTTQFDFVGLRMIMRYASSIAA